MFKAIPIGRLFGVDLRVHSTLLWLVGLVAVGSLTSLLEPLLIVVMGGAVFAIVLALFLPLLTIIDTLTGGG